MPDNTTERGNGEPSTDAVKSQWTEPGSQRTPSKATAEFANVVAWDEGSPGFGIIKLRDLSSDAEVIVGRTGFNNHGLSLGGRSVAWIESPAGDTSGTGRIMLQRYPADLNAANDNPWTPDHQAACFLGSEPVVADLVSGDTLLTWIGTDGNAHGRLYPLQEQAAVTGADAPEYAAVNASLADLGPVVATSEGGRRLQVVETRPGSFAVMWLALADSNVVLRGNLFTTIPDASTDPNAVDHWTTAPIADVRLPAGFTGQFSLQAAADGSADAIVTYSEVNAETNGAMTLARRIDGSATDGTMGQLGPEYPIPTPAAEQFNQRATPATAAVDSDSQPTTSAADADTDAHALQIEVAGPPAAPTPADGSGSSAMLPIVRETLNGFVVAWQDAGASDDTVTLKLTMFDAHGAARTLIDGDTVITITNNAAATVAPAITGVGEGAAVGYVDADSGILVVQAYSGDGAQIGDAVIVDTAEAGAISEVALGSAGEGGTHENQLAVVYVRDDHDDQPDYGSIMLQRYELPSPQEDSGHLVALGGDVADNGVDEPVELTSPRDGDPAIDEAAHGRAPAVAELNDGELAIVWVEYDGTRETINGCVIEADGQQVLHIDLTALLPEDGIARGTKPTLLATSDGDIVVSWLQPDGEDGYVLMAAFYEAAGTGAWIAPAEPIRLRAFDEEPEDYSVTLSDQDGIALNVFWRSDNSGSGDGDILSQRFDIDGNDLGRAQKLSGDDDDSLPADTVSAASLLDGQIVVVYTEESRNGGVDLAAHVIEASTGDTGNAAAAVNTYALEDRRDDGYAASGNSFSTDIDQEVTINLLPGGLGAGAVSYINGVAITTATPIDVGHGWVQLREDGQLTVSPNSEYTGKIEFDYSTGGSSGGSDLTKRVIIDVVSEPASDSVVLKSPVTTLLEGASASSDIKLAEISASDGDVNPDGLSLAGLDADMFRIVGTTLYLRAGVDLDFETKPTLSVEIRPDRDASEAGISVNFTLEVENKQDANSLNDDYGSTYARDSGDTFVFAPSFGSEAGDNANGVHEVIDVSSSGYKTLQEMLDAGALLQSGADVVLTFDPTDPEHSDRITLRGIDLSVLTSADFKF